ncbi:hypothetical protein Ahy_A08g039440 [Arachis hypogaea]|uniref:Reverse transcriptase zinc-binding domain-containing protein n=1 Tax=Arachis hypogaea TaxID=3818 RepID=A0A445BWR4_ARAHY|nr:hypothetical protein Ahy_A08g039440 [Arachis hypogaea]
MFNHARLTALPAILSDHCPLILDMRPNQKIPGLFRYESYWDDREDCKKVIKKRWNEGNNNGDDWKNLLEKTKNCIKVLKEWNRTNFKRADKDIAWWQSKIQISRQDKLIWPYRQDGNYTVKTEYHIAKKEEEEKYSKDKPLTSTPLEDLWLGIWNMRTPQKIKMFLWRTIHNILLAEETTEHALLLCDWTRAVWFGSQAQCTPTKKSVNSVGMWLQEMFRKCNQGGKIGANQMWSRIEPDPKSTINHAKNLELEYFKATEKKNKKENNSTNKSNRRRTVPIIWRSPPQNWLKLNTDAAFSNDTKSGSIAVDNSYHRLQWNPHGRDNFKNTNELQHSCRSNCYKRSNHFNRKSQN